MQACAGWRDFLRTRFNIDSGVRCAGQTSVRRQAVCLPRAFARDDVAIRAPSAPPPPGWDFDRLQIPPANPQDKERAGSNVITGHFYWSRDAFERDIEVLECNWTIDTVWCNSTATCAGVGQRGHPLRRSARQPAAARTAQQVVGGAARGAGDGSGVCGMNQLRPALFSSATTSSSASPVKQTRRNTRRPANHPLTMAATSPKSMAMANAASMKTR